MNKWIIFHTKKLGIVVCSDAQTVHTYQTFYVTKGLVDIAEDKLVYLEHCVFILI